MLGYVIAKSRKRGAEEEDEPVVPPDLRRRLRAWVDVDEVGLKGFWIWLRAVVPLLPSPDAPAKRPSIALGSPRETIRQLEQRLALYAREQSRLSVICDQAVRDNELLVRRLRALEAALRTLDLGGHKIVIPPDPDVADAAERYASPARTRTVGPSRPT